MSTIALNVRRVKPKAGFAAGTIGSDILDRDLGRARKLALLMDGKYSLFGVRFGLDAVIGLVPGIGDTVSAFMGGYLLYVAWKHKLGGDVIGVMILNLLLDWLVGLIPALGDLFDVFFKAHLRNLAVLEKAVARQRGQ